MSANNVLDALSNNKLIAGLIVLSVGLSVTSIAKNAEIAANVRTHTEQLAKLDATKELVARMEEREKERDRKINEMYADIKVLLQRIK